MPPFDFPATPAVGDLSNGYQWTGEMWSGAPMLGQAPSEQFFNLSGLSQLDIQVPAWAEAVQIEGSCWAPGTNFVIMRVSLDGSTFLGAATDYYHGGPVHNTGSAGYTAVAPGTGYPYIPLTFQGDLATVPHMFTAQTVLKRPDTVKILGFTKTYSKSWDSAATMTSRTFWMLGYCANTSVGSALAIKALRITSSAGGVFGANSHVRLKWLGDIAQVPPANGIEDAPSDGCEYVRVNGIWRKKSQSFILDGLTNFDLAVPPLARAVRVYASLMPPNPGVASNSVLLKASLDGTTFLAGASDYHYSGFIYYSGTSAIAANLGSVVSANCYIAFNNDSNIVQEVIDLRMSMVRPTVPSAQPWYGMVNSISYQSAAANLYNAAQMRVGVMNTNAGAVTALKALRIHRNANAIFGSPSYADVTWSY